MKLPVRFARQNQPVFRTDQASQRLTSRRFQLPGPCVRARSPRQHNAVRTPGQQVISIGRKHDPRQSIDWCGDAANELGRQRSPVLKEQDGCRDESANSDSNQHHADPSCAHLPSSPFLLNESCTTQPDFGSLSASRSSPKEGPSRLRDCFFSCNRLATLSPFRTGTPSFLLVAAMSAP